MGANWRGFSFRRRADLPLPHFLEKDARNWGIRRGKMHSEGGEERKHKGLYSSKYSFADQISSTPTFWVIRPDFVLRFPYWWCIRSFHPLITDRSSLVNLV